MDDVFVVMASTYLDFDSIETEEGAEHTINNEDETSCETVGVYTSITAAAEACYSFIEEYEVDADEYQGPIEQVWVESAKLGAPPGNTHRLASLPDEGSKTQFLAELHRELAKT